MAPDDTGRDDLFDRHLEAWDGYTASPWGRLRYALVRHALERTLAGLGEGPLRVLDVGGGDGLDALPIAEAGHDVTVVDTSESMLASGRRRAAERGVDLTWVHAGLDDLVAPAYDPGAFDLVLLHFVVQYRPDTSADVRALVRLLRPHGRLSLVAPNPDGAVLARAVRSGPEEAADLLGSQVMHTVTFGTDVRAVGLAEGRSAVEAAGCDVVGQFGGRVVNDLLPDDGRKDDPDHFAALLALELQLCDREPFRSVGQYWQLVGERRTPLEG